MTGYTPLDNLVSALTGNSALCTLVNSKIYKNKAISASVVDLGRESLIGFNFVIWICQ